MNMTAIKINKLVVDKYLVNYTVDITEKYADQPNFTAVSGKKINKYLGDRRTIKIDFEPMETAQINELFNEIKAIREHIPIEYIDPQQGKVIKRFSCSSLPSATYFVSDDGRQFWTIPTVTFEETEDDYSETTEDG